jgi:septation ring formation regulator EzrA
LDSIEKQQDEVEVSLEMMSKKLGDGNYKHELSEYLEDYDRLRQDIIDMQEDGGDWNDPGNEQLLNIFENLNQVEMQVKEMDQLVDVYLSNYN